MDDRPGLVRVARVKPARVKKSDRQAFHERLDRLTSQGREAGAKETVCTALAPETCRTPMERAAWVDGYMDGFAKQARKELRYEQR